MSPTSRDHGGGWETRRRRDVTRRALKQKWVPDPLRRKKNKKRDSISSTRAKGRKAQRQVCVLTIWLANGAAPPPAAPSPPSPPPPPPPSMCVCNAPPGCVFVTPSFRRVGRLYSAGWLVFGKSEEPKMKSERDPLPSFPFEQKRSRSFIPFLFQNTLSVPPAFFASSPPGKGRIRQRNSSQSTTRSDVFLVFTYQPLRRLKAHGRP